MIYFSAPQVALDCAVPPWLECAPQITALPTRSRALELVSEGEVGEL